MAQEQMGSPVSLCNGGLDARRLVIGDLSSRETTEEEDDYAVFSGEEEEEEDEEDEEDGWREDRFCFYFVKQFAYDDPEIKAKIDEADNEIYNCNSERIHIANRLKAKRAERLSLMSSLDVMKDQETTNRLSEVKMEMELLDAQMGCVLDQRDRAFERIKLLRIQRDKGNAAFFQSRAVMKKAIELAACGNFRDLEELAYSEVDKFMSRWNNDKAFRDDYKKRILPSRKLRGNEQIRSSECDVDTENRDETAIELKRFCTEEEEESDKEALKEKRREEQLEKARLAMERKRKLHEKAAAKAAIRAKKEAEKKLKELEKRAKKKKVLERTPETVTEASELEKEKPLNGRSVSWNQRSLRYRHHKKGNENVPKAILKRRRAYRLWVWSVSSAALALPLALFIVFFYVR